jgi:hypothetical protein
MRVLVLLACLFFFVGVAVAQEGRDDAAPAKPCGNQAKWTIPDEYYSAVLADIRPVGLGQSLIRITTGGEIKLVLWTDGEKFMLSTDTFDLPQKSIWQFLLDLDRACRLPTDPNDAAALIKIHWEHKELSAAEFATIHERFSAALVNYVSKIQSRYSPLLPNRMIGSYVDAVQYSIVYDNNSEHIEIGAWNVPENHVLNPMATWVHELRKVAEASFHRSFQTVRTM